MKVALYARVSKSKDQTNENQLLELRRWASAAGHEIIGEWVDEISSRDTRPQKEALRGKLVMGEVRAVAFVSLDRWGRSMGELVNDLDEFLARGVVVYSMREQLVFDSASGILQARIIAAFAAFERDRIRERTLQGLNRARAQGKRFGRPIREFDVEKARLMRVEGKSWRKIAIMLKVPAATIRARLVNGAQQSPPVSDGVSAHSGAVDSNTPDSCKG